MSPNSLKIAKGDDRSSFGVFSISGKEVKLVDTVPMGDSVSAVSFTPDGKHALVAKYMANKIAYVAIDGQKVTWSAEGLAGQLCADLGTPGWESAAVIA